MPNPYRPHDERENSEFIVSARHDVDPLEDWQVVEMKRNFWFSIALLGCLPLLGGCGAAAVTMIDETMSSFTGKECRVRHVFNDDKAICYEAVSLPQGPRVFCYRTLGSIDCYREPNPLIGDAFKIEPQPPIGGLPPFGVGS